MLKVNTTPRQRMRTNCDDEPCEDGQWCELCNLPGTSEICHELYEHFACTLRRGHLGPHAACGLDANEHPIIEWETVPDTDPKQETSDAP